MLAVWAVACSLAAQDQGAAVRDGFVQRYCVDCHGGDTVKGKLDLTRPAPDPAAELWRWSRLQQRVQAGEMPPLDHDALPDAAARAEFAAAVQARLAVEVPKLPVDPGRSTVRRLNRTQWENCVRDLFGVEVSTAGFPADDLGYGFDTVGDALTFSTLHLEKYLAAADAVAAAVIDGEDPARPTRRRCDGSEFEVIEGGLVLQNDGRTSFCTNGRVARTETLPRAGSYRLRLEAGADPCGSAAALMVVRVGDVEVASFEVHRRPPREFECTLDLPAGPVRVEVAFVNDHTDSKHADPGRRDRNLHLERFSLDGPLDRRVVPKAQQWVHDAIAGAPPPRQLSALAAAVLPRVWRRPLLSGELARVVAAAEQQLGREVDEVAARRFVLSAALVSPHFLFRVEPVVTDAAAGVAVPLPGPVLASRLSFFVWASAPDPALIAAAAAGRLSTAAGLTAELDRLLADARASALATDFAGQWLELKALQDRMPDPARFPGFDDGLRASMRRQTELLFLTVLRERLPVRTLLEADFTHVDVNLAAFLGWPAPSGPGFERVALPPERRDRGGLLGHPSVHTITSNPTRTSPVKRGRWILDNLLGQAPPPPPPGNDSLANEAGVDSAKSFREQLAQHRERSACAVCHVRMDALGFALEHYDAIGRHRERDAGGAIDSRGALPDGTVLQGLPQLAALVAADPAFVRTVAHKLFVYGNGRDLRPIDRLRLDRAVAAAAAAGPVTLPDLIRVVVLDDAFRLVIAGR